MRLGRGTLSCEVRLFSGGSSPPRHFFSGTLFVLRCFRLNNKSFFFLLKYSLLLFFFLDFACQTVIIINNEIPFNGNFTKCVYDFLREDEVLEAARDFGISFYVVGQRVSFDKQLFPSYRFELCELSAAVVSVAEQK